MSEQRQRGLDGSAADRSTPRVIHTPDRRVRVFVSSTLQELAEERRAVRAAITGVRLTPVMFELGAHPHPPRELYRAYLGQSDVFVGVYWQRYGWIAPGEAVSGLEDEYLLSGDRPKLIYVRTPAEQREPRLVDLLTRVERDNFASYKEFSDPTELAELVADDLAVLLTERFAASRAERQDLQVDGLPVPLNEIIGRDSEVAAICAALRRPAVRLVTVVGPGGIGKTRVALEVAASMSGDVDVVRFVDLAPVTDPLLVTAAVAAGLGFRVGNRPIRDVLADRLAGARALLVLDNFEHLLSAATEIAELLAGCPGLIVVITSRSVLRLRGEHEFALAPLPTAAPVGSATDGADGVPAAVQLFVARAREVRAGFGLSGEAAPDVAEICRRLEGIPLAIELAAAQIRLLSPGALLRRLGARLDLPGGHIDLPQRQRTLRATLDWSHSLLAEDERVLLARLSVFAGGWTLDAAEAVAGADGELDLLRTMSSLVAHSLVAADERCGAEPRFRMLDTIREYARERLQERGEDAATMRRLADWLRDVSDRAGTALRGPDNRLWATRLDADLDNLRAAMQWAVAVDDAETVVRIAAPPFTYWWKRGLLAQMLALADETAALPSASRLPDDAAALLLWSRGTMRVALGRVEEATPFLRRLVELTDASGDSWLSAAALACLGLALPYDTDAEQARALLERAVTMFRRLGDPWGLAFVLTPLGHLALRDGDVDVAIAMHRESLTKAEEIDDDHMRAQAQNQLGLDAMVSGLPTEARGWFAASARVYRSLADQEGLAFCLDGFAAVALALGSADAAARLLGAAGHARAIVGVAVWPLLRPLADSLVAAVRAALPAETFASSHAAGSQMRPTDAVAYALAVTSSERSTPDRPSPAERPA